MSVAGVTSQQPRERREHSAIGGGVPGRRYLATKDAELMAEYRDLDVLLVRGRSESNQIEQLTIEQEGDRTAHSDDRDRCTAVLVSGRIARLHPSGTFLTRVSKFRADGRVLPQYIWIRQARGTMQEAVRLGAKSVRVPRSSRLLRFASDRARPAEVDRGFKPSPHFGGDVEAVF